MQWCHGINNCCSIVFFPPSQLISVTEVANTSQLVLFTKNDSRMKSNEEKNSFESYRESQTFCVEIAFLVHRKVYRSTSMLHARNVVSL